MTTAKAKENDGLVNVSAFQDHLVCIKVDKA